MFNVNVVNMLCLRINRETALQWIQIWWCCSVLLVYDEQLLWFQLKYIYLQLSIVHDYDIDKISVVFAQTKHN